MAPNNSRVQRTGNGWNIDASARGGRCFLHVQPNGKLTDTSGAELVKSDFRIAEAFLREIGEVDVAKNLH